MTESSELNALLIEEIQRLRGNRNWSQKELADRAGIDEARLSRRMRAVSPLTTLEIEALCDAFEVDLLDFLSDLRAAAERRIR